MAPFLYRLQLLLERKEEARKEAEKELTRREDELQAQRQELQKRQDREKQLIARRERLRGELLAPSAGSAPLSAREIQKRSDDVRVVGLEIEDAKKDVLARRQLIEQGEARVKEAQTRVEEARREVEVLTKHRTKQEDRFLREEQAKEDLALDEIGNVLHATRRDAT